MQANGSNWQQFPCGNSEQPPPRVNTWQGKQGPVEDRFMFVLNNVVYVGMAIKMIESVTGEKLLLQFLDGRRSISRDICTPTWYGLTVSPPPPPQPNLGQVVWIFPGQGGGPGAQQN